MSRHLKVSIFERLLAALGIRIDQARYVVVPPEFDCTVYRQPRHALFPQDNPGWPQ